MRVSQGLILTYFSAANSLSTSSKCLKSPCEKMLAIGRRIASKHAPQHSSHLDECHVFAFVTGKFLHPGVSDLKCIVQVVDDGHFTPVIQQAEDSMTACTHDLSHSVLNTHRNAVRGGATHKSRL